MRKQLKPLTRSFLFAACTAVVAASVGCEPAQTQADKRVQESLEAVVQAQATGNVQEADSLLQKVSAEPDASDPLRLQVLALMGESAWKKGVAVFPELNRHEAAALQALAEIDRLGAKLTGENLMIAAYAGANPTGDNSPLAAAKANQQQSNQQSAALQAQIDETKKAADAQAAKIASLQAARKQAADQAADFLIKSEQTGGEESVNLFKQSTALRQKATLLAHELSVAETQLRHTQTLVAQLEDQKKSADAAAAAAAEQAAQIQAGWTTTQARMAERNAEAKKILESAGIIEQARALAKAMDEAAKARKVADEHLGTAVERYAAAAALGIKTYADLTRQIQDPAYANAPQLEAWKRMQTSVHQMNYAFTQARVLSHRGNVYLNLRNVLETQRVVAASLASALQAAKLAAPKELVSASLAEEIASATKLARQYLADADKIFADIAERGQSPAQKSQAAVERVLVLYALYQIGDKKALAEAQNTLKELVANDSAMLLPALPSELEPMMQRKAVAAPTGRSAAPARAPAVPAAPAPATAPAVEQ